jgi:hypothetical protein
MLPFPVRAFVTASMLAGLSLTGASSAWAVAVTPLSYDLPNGDGQAHGGSFNYWDKAYTGSGDPTADRAALSGGHGDLTDGVIATQNWFNVENNEGTGPYVGWRDLDPTIVFHFGESLRFSSITLHADDADGAGGVFAPGGITVGGTTYTFADPAGSAPNTFTIGGLDLIGSDLQVTVHRRFDSAWTFVSEVTFTASPVPEPGTLALAVGGIGVLAGRRHLLKARGNGRRP